MTQSHTTATVGKQIRDLRKARGMTLTELATKVNRSVGYISQAERDKSEVTIACLNTIAQALRVDLGWFFEKNSSPDSSESEYIVRAQSRRRLNFVGAGMTEELLSPSISGDSLMILNESSPGAHSGGFIKRGVEMSGYILSGTMKLIFEDENFELTMGDSFVIPPNKPHDFENIGDNNCEVIWYLTPAIY